MSAPLTPNTYLFDDAPVHVDSSASATLLHMTDEEKEEARERERSRGTFGFGRAFERCTSVKTFYESGEDRTGPLAMPRELGRLRCEGHDGHHGLHRADAPSGETCTWD